MLARWGRPFLLVFENRESPAHNLSIRDAGGTTVFKGEVIAGLSIRVYEVSALPPGRYALRCDIHPEMASALTAR